MSTKLSLWVASCSRLDQLVRVGSYASARKLVVALLSWPTLDGVQTVALLKRGAEIASTSQRYRLARTYLRQAIALEPTDADLYFQLGVAFETDPFGCDRKARVAYRKATTLNADHPQFRAHLGRAMIRINELDSGIRVLCKAAAAAPTDTDVLEVLVEGLREAGRSDLAFKLLSKSRFLAPRDNHIEQLWARAKYDVARQNQKRIPGTEPSIRPFLRLVSASDDRMDASSEPKAHIGRLRAFRTDRGN